MGATGDVASPEGSALTSLAADEEPEELASTAGSGRGERSKYATAATATATTPAVTKRDQARLVMASRSSANAAE